MEGRRNEGRRNDSRKRRERNTKSEVRKEKRMVGGEKSTRRNDGTHEEESLISRKDG